MKKQYILLLWLLTCYTSLLQAQNQQITDYQFIASQGVYIPLANATSLPEMSKDNEVKNNLPIGFTFRYAENDYDKFAISSNGFITLGSSATNLNQSYFFNALILGLNGQSPVIAPLWDDLDMSSGTVSYKTEGIVGRQILTIEWLNAEWNNQANEPTISFQVKLHEVGGRIEFTYRQEAGALSNPSASIGITNPSSCNLHYLLLNNTSQAPTVSKVSATHHINTKPATGQVYTFSPPRPVLKVSEKTPNGSQDVSSRRLGFGILHGQSSVTKTLTIENEGSLPLELSNINLTGAGFSIDGQLPNTIAPGDSAKLTLRYNYNENNDGRLSFDTNDPANRFEFMLLRGFLLPHFSAKSGTFTPLTNATNANLSNNSILTSLAKNLDIGFNFNYLGQSYDKFDIAADGYLLLGDSFFSISLSDNNLFNASGFGAPMIAPLWDDLDMSNGVVSYKTEGVFGNRVLTVEWLNAKWNAQANTPTISFQVKLYEANGKIEFIYGQEAGALFNPSASIGITNASIGNTSYLSLNNTSSAPTASNIIESHNINAKPATGQVYVFSSPTPVLKVLEKTPNGARDVSGRRLGFGILHGQSSVTKTLTIQNEGSLPLELSNINLTGAGFSIDGQLPNTIAPGDSAKLTLRYDYNENNDGNLSFNTNDPSNRFEFMFLQGFLLPHFSAKSSTFTPLTNATNANLSNNSFLTSLAKDLNIGFNFNYLGQSYDKFDIAADGYLLLGDNAASISLSGNNLFNATGFGIPIIAPLWDNLDMSSGVVSYKTEGVFGNRVLTVEWLNAKWNAQANTPSISFQVKLYEADGKIEFIYGQEAGVLFNPSASIGITSTSIGNTGYLSLNNTSSAPTVSNIIENRNINAKPATGQVYTFAPHPPPTITNFTPTQNKIGSSITITGTNFSPIAANNMVKFNGVTATVTSATATEIQTIVPSGATTGKITVEVNKLTATSSNNFTVILPPTITSFTPNQGMLNTNVIIRGTNFSPIVGNNTVKFNGVIAPVSSATATEIQTLVPTNATTGKITVEVNGETATSATDFTVIPSTPTIIGFTPNQATVGTQVIIGGTNFSPITANNIVKFNGVRATVLSATATEILTLVPINATTGKITVEVNGETAISTTDFTIIHPTPTIIGFTPNRATVGTQVIIGGTNFSPITANNIVKFNGVRAMVLSATATEIRTRVPLGATTGKITVEVNGKTAISSIDFAVTQPSPNAPTITSFTPDRAVVGANVTITGSNFSNNPLANFVMFNGIPAIVISATSTQIQTFVPLGATTGRVSVEVNFETAMSTTDFTVISQPTITSFTPTQGEVRSQVTIKGADFSPIATNNTVKFNGVTATVISATTTEIKASVPSGATTGKVTIEVNGITARSNTDFTVILSPNAPQITSFSPGQGEVGTNVTITGDNFSPTRANNTVKFNGVKATVISATATEIQASVPSNATTGKITVEVNGETATSASEFNVVPPAPTVAGFTPSRATIGTSITIVGTNFSSILANNTVKFNGVKATVLSATATEIRTRVPLGATTGKITVEVNNQTATSIIDFTVTQPSPNAPTITNFTPDRAIVGANVTITGSNFSTNPLANFVMFNGIPAIVTSATSTQIQTSVPLGATTGRITVEVNFETATSATDFTVSPSEITALPQNLKEAELILYPNPFSKDLTMEVKGKVRNNLVKIVVLNNQGKTVLVTKQTLVNGRLTLPMQKLSAGKYLVKIYIKDEVVLRRVVKL